DLGERGLPDLRGRVAGQQRLALTVAAHVAAAGAARAGAALRRRATVGPVLRRRALRGTAAVRGRAGQRRAAESERGESREAGDGLADLPSHPSFLLCRVRDGQLRTAR